MADWLQRPRYERHRIVTQIGRSLYSLWQDRIDLRRLPLELSIFRQVNGEWEWHCPPDQLERNRFRLSTDSVRSALLDAYGSAGIPFSPLEVELLLRSFLRPQGLDRIELRQLIQSLKAALQIQSALRPDLLYRRALRTENAYGTALYRGCWTYDPQLSPGLLAGAVAQAERTAGEPLKKSHRNTVWRAHLLERDVVIKRFDLPRWHHRVRAAFQPSRARRAWAAGQALRALHFATPEPLGFLEVQGRFLPSRSYVFSAYESASIDLRTWFLNHYSKLSPTQQQASLSAFREAWLRLYHARIYHGDAKLANCLVRPQYEAGIERAQQLAWIDLEDMRFGVWMNPYRVLRNLMQINGSLHNRHLTEAERFAFIHPLRHIFPYLEYDVTKRLMRWWTRKRWRKERRRRCGS